MLHVETLHASSAAATAAYYTRYLTEAPGEGPGVWSGGQAAGLGLAGEVTGEQLELLLQGRDPVSGATLGSVLKDRIGPKEKEIKAVAGFDATFSAPKTVSVWWGLTQDERLLAAHDAGSGGDVDASGAVRVDDPDPRQRPPSASRHPRVDDGVVPADDVAG
jgi:hypothetical protein